MCSLILTVTLQSAPISSCKNHRNDTKKDDLPKVIQGERREAGLQPQTLVPVSFNYHLDTACGQSSSWEAERSSCVNQIGLWA